LPYTVLISKISFAQFSTNTENVQIQL